MHWSGMSTGLGVRRLNPLPPVHRVTLRKSTELTLPPFLHSFIHCLVQKLVLGICYGTGIGFGLGIEWGTLRWGARMGCLSGPV